VLLGTAALAALGVAGAACGKPPPPPDLQDLVAQRERALADSQLASDAVATAKPELKPGLSAVASDRSKHAQALSDEIARMTGEPVTSTSATTTTTPAQATAPTVKDVVAALRKSADSATQLAAQLSGYRAGLLGSIAASCTAAYQVALV
jgi:hypothetical protein